MTQRISRETALADLLDLPGRQRSPCSRLRPGVGGAFGPECILPIAPARKSAALELAADAAQIGRSFKAPAAAPLRRQTEPRQASSTRMKFYPVRIPLRGARQAPAWTVGDFNGDGRGLLCSKGAGIWPDSHIFEYRRRLWAEPRCCDSLAGINAISLTEDGDLLVFAAPRKNRRPARPQPAGRIPAVPCRRPLPGPPDRPPGPARRRSGSAATPPLPAPPPSRSSRWARSCRPAALWPTLVDLPNDPDAIRIWPLGGSRWASYYNPTSPGLADGNRKNWRPPGLRRSMRRFAAAGRRRLTGAMLLALGRAGREFAW